MRRRLASILLTALVVLTGVAVGTCPLGRCLSMQSTADAAPHTGHGSAQHAEVAARPDCPMHDRDAGEAHVTVADTAMPHVASEPAVAARSCCSGDAITRPPCCDDAGQLAAQHTVPSSDRASHVLQLVATQPVPAGLAALTTPTPDPRRPAPPGAPPGTLLTQHTSLQV